MNTITLKENAKNHLKGSWIIAILAMIIVDIFSGSSSLTFVEPLLAGFGILTLFLVPVHVGYSKFHVNLAKGNKAKINDLFYGFRDGKYFKSLFGMLLMFLYLIGWIICLVVPGLIKMFSYAMTSMVLQDPDYDNLSGNEAITKSRELMFGHKLELFYVIISFIGWILLSIITFGILFFYTVPYMQQTIAEFYIELKSKKQ